MGFERMKYTPENGLKDTEKFPATPVSEGAAREQFQRLFDQVKVQVNALMAALENAQNGTGGAGKIGVGTIEGISGTTVYEMLESLKSQIDFARIGETLPTNCVNTAQVVSSAITYEKMAFNSVGTNQLIAGSVTSGKLTAGAVTAEKLAAIPSLTLALRTEEGDGKKDELVFDTDNKTLNLNLAGLTPVQLAPVVFGTLPPPSDKIFPPGTIYVQHV